MSRHTDHPDFAPAQHPVVLFDGLCSFCNYWVNTLIRWDSAGRYQFASIQSSTGRELLERSGIDPQHVNTVVLIENGRIYTRSTAVIRIAAGLGGRWKLAALAYVIPRDLRDWAYDLIAANRHRWFGCGQESQGCQRAL